MNKDNIMDAFILNINGSLCLVLLGLILANIFSGPNLWDRNEDGHLMSERQLGI